MHEVALRMDELGNAGRDSTTLSIVEIDLSTLATLQAPTYRVVKERGRQHPLVKTQYFNEEIDAQAGMFNEGRMALMFGGEGLNTKDTKDTKREQRIEVRAYAFLVDVAGMDEVALTTQEDGVGNPGRDSTTLSIVEVDLTTMRTLQAPTYRVVRREAWTGIDHLAILPDGREEGRRAQPVR